MKSFQTTLGLWVSLLLLALVAPLSDAKEASLLASVSVERSLLVVPDTEYRSLQDGNLTVVVVDELDGEEDDHDDHDDHDDEGDHDDEDDHDEDHDEELAALEAKCMCAGGNLFCSDAEGLEDCHCEDGEVHCEHHDDHAEDHIQVGVEDHDDHDDHDDHAHDHAEHMYDDDDDSKPWGIVTGASFIINLTTLTGVFLIGGHWGRKLCCKDWTPKPQVGQLWVNVIIPMFACGTLMATTFFLLLPEALHLIESDFSGGHDDQHRRLQDDHDDHDDHGDESAATWRWGTAVMGGFLFPVLLHAFFSHADMDGHVHAPMIENQDENPETAATSPKPADAEGAVVTAVPVDAEKTRKSVVEDEYVNFCGCLRLVNLPLFVSMNLGEMLHNFTDGIFVGAAYVGCGPEFGNSVVLATVLHEIPNQLAGYLVMVNQNKIDPVVALVLNFLFGLSTWVGALVVLVLDLGNLAIGCIFGVGAGLFLHVAIREMLSTAEGHAKGYRHMLYMFLAFAFGAVLIGLVLISHEHCGGH